jgi:hypothetical protein
MEALATEHALDMTALIGHLHTTARNGHVNTLGRDDTSTGKPRVPGNSRRFPSRWRVT